MKKLLIAFLLIASVAGAQTLTVGSASLIGTGHLIVGASDTSTVSVDAATWTSVLSMSEYVDVNGEFSPTTGVFTAATAKNVLICFGTDNTGYEPNQAMAMILRGVDLTVAGTYVRNYASYSYGSNPHPLIIKIVRLAAGEKLTFINYCDSGTGAKNRIGSHLEIYQLP